MDQPLIAGKYEILREIGTGGSATVYLARAVDRTLDTERLVAVKVLRDDGMLDSARTRFSQEIRVLGKLVHPAIVPLFDSGVWSDRPFLVMPYIEGETLSRRIARSGRLTPSESVKIALDLCDALGYAHSLRVLHRDVKPSNVLLAASGRAMLADFGVARWLELTGDERPTLSGDGAPGTIAYSSPEQLAGERNLDARSDIYSLGVVLFEALCGEHPFAAVGARAMLATRLLGAPPSLRERGVDVSEELDAVVSRAMNPDVSARFSSVAEMTQALRYAAALEDSRAFQSLGSGSVAMRRDNGHETPSGAAYWLSPRRWRRRTTSIVTFLAAGIVVAFAYAARAASLRSASAPDLNRIALLPFDGSDSAGVTRGLQRALGRYADLLVVDELQLADVMSPTGDVPLTLSARHRIAGRVGAGRWLTVRLSRDSTASRVDAYLYTTGAMGSEPARASIALSPQTTAIADGANDELFAALVDSLLFGKALDARAPLLPGTRAANARVEFLKGMAAVRSWEIEVADSSFSRALALDPDYASAELWLAQLHDWKGDDLESLRPRIARASRNSAQLSEREQTMLGALEGMLDGEMLRACRVYRDILRTEPRDVVALLGVAECTGRDRAVIRSPTSPSGWAFRSSARETIDAYRYALSLLPSSSRTFHDNAFQNLRALLYTQASPPRVGRSSGASSTLFAALPGWDARGDSLAFVPYPMQELAERTPSTLGIALVRNRRVFLSIARNWVSSLPNSVEAREALAIAQSSLGDQGAIESIVRARELSRDRATSLRLAVNHVSFLLQFGVGSDSALVRAAVTLGDSLLDHTTAGGAESASALASVAALSKRPNDAVRFQRLAAEPLAVPLPAGEFVLPTTIAADIGEMRLRAVLDSSSEKVAELSARILDEIRGLVDETKARQIFSVVMAQAAQLAYASRTGVSSLFERVDPAGNDLLAAQSALRKGDTAAVRQSLSALRKLRANIPAAEWSIDAVYPEASLMAAVGDTAGALNWLETSLRSISGAGPEFVRASEQGASLRRALELRRRLALRRDGDALGRRLETSTAPLWRSPSNAKRP